MGSRKLKLTEASSSTIESVCFFILLEVLFNVFFLAAGFYLDAGRLQQRHCLNPCRLRRRHATESNFGGYLVNAPRCRSP